MASPASPTNVVPTVNSNDEITLTWDYDPTWFAFDGDDDSLGGFNEGRWYTSEAVDGFEVQINRDGNGWTGPAGGSNSINHDSSTSYTESYGPDSSGGSSKDFDGSIGIDSQFQFRVRAVSNDGSSDWTVSSTVRTDTLPPKNVHVTRPNANKFEIHWNVGSNIANITKLRVRKDDGSGYGGWANFRNVDPSSSPTLVEVGDVGNWDELEITEDARYQFLVEHEYPGIGTSTPVYADYGNFGNVYFSDDFSSGDASAWDSNSIGTGGITDTLNSVYNAGDATQTPEVGGYAAEMGDAGWLTKNLGDLSDETDVHVRLRVQLASNDSSGEDGEIHWYDGSNWQELDRWGWEYDGQGWIEVHSTVPDSWLDTDNRVRIGRDGGGGIDFVAFDEVIVSDILHEYTKPAAPSNPSTDSSSEGELTLSWTNNSAFAGDEAFTRVYGSGDSFEKNFWNTPHTWDGLKDGEKYEWYPSEVTGQPRNGDTNIWFRSNGPTVTATTVLPEPSNPNLTATSDSSLSASWVDEANNEDGNRVYYREVGGSWSQVSDLSPNVESETISGLTQDTEYEFKVENYTEHATSESGVVSASTFLNELRSTESHSSRKNSSSARVIDLSEDVSSHGDVGDSTAIRVVDLLEEVQSSSSPISVESIRVVDLLEEVTSASLPAGSSSQRLVDLYEDVTSHAAATDSSAQRVISVYVSPESNSDTLTSVSDRSSLSLAGRNAEVSHSNAAKSSSIRLINLLEDVESSASISGGEADRSQLDYGDRDATPATLSQTDSSAIRVVDLLESVESHGEPIRSSVYNDRTSLELIDRNLYWNDEKAFWTTDWFQEDRILGSEDNLAIRSVVVEDAKEPAATVIVEYDKNGDGKVDAASDRIDLGSDQEVQEIGGVPIDEDGYYRLKITNYSGYNSLTVIDTAIVN